MTEGESSRHAVTTLLRRWGDGDRQALESLMPLVYDELRGLAVHHLRAERPDHTLQPTALVHEAYLRLIDQKNVVWQNRAHFFGIASQMMRRILVDHARRRNASKRDGSAYRIELGGEEGSAESPDRDAELLALDRALTQLEELDPRQSRIVELRFFGGLTVEETAEVAGVSTATVKREFRTARAWLRHELNVAGAGA
ncbi:MAG TPA: sigma-70 family RNA polymerase sigma factor [Thermoanaerobaculia bacterium]|nr:sigma-70 family RNA polymerase sigma factor [Thermoanaerobaculia bacterium]